MNNFNIYTIASTVFWVISVILVCMAISWFIRYALPGTLSGIERWYRKIASVYYSLYEKRADVSPMIKEARESWLEIRKRNSSMFNDCDRSRARTSFLEAEHAALTLYLAFKRDAKQEEKGRLRDLRKKIKQVNSA